MSHPEGLSEAEVRERRVADRSNTMPSGTGRTYSGDHTYKPLLLL